MSIKGYLASITLSVGALALSACVTSSPVEVSSADAIHRTIISVTDDISVFENGHHRALIVETDDSLVLVDTISADGARWLSGELQSRLNKPVSHILYSHNHWDHASGAGQFPQAKVISHIDTIAELSPPSDYPLAGMPATWDKDGNGMLSLSEASNPIADNFATADANSDGQVSGLELFQNLYADVRMPDETYSVPVNRLSVGGKIIEMHHVPNEHAPDMSYVYFPEEKLLFVVDVISNGALPFGPLTWYEKDDFFNITDSALKFDADILVTGHGPVGTLQDVRNFQNYMADLRQGVLLGIQQGKTVEQVKAALPLEAYKDWDYFERVSDNIDGMYRALKAEGY